ncbi:MAG TPA: hypothetical protein VFS43_43335 [Polyangiaceae bacterium]|nr:hypothetical protein [Polyangiaceae bacterium]
MSKDALVAELDPLTHHDRTRRLVQVGRRAAAGDALESALQRCGF